MKRLDCLRIGVVKVWVEIWNHPIYYLISGPRSVI